MKKLLLISLFSLPASLFAQQDLYYFHTIHSSSFAAMYGRTVKAHYAYQLSHRRQLKISGAFVSDDYTKNNDDIRADVYNVNLQFQYNMINKKKFFSGVHVGVGGYLLNAEDEIGLKQKERNVNFVGGAQAEFYIWRNNLALVVDYDVLYMPFSKVYRFLHIPTAGLSIFF